MNTHTLFVEKLPHFANDAKHLLHGLRESLNLPSLTSLRILNRYEIIGISPDEFAQAASSILSEPQTDTTSTHLPISENETAFAFSYLPGQFDQRADSAAQCIQILTGKDKPTVLSSQIVILNGHISPAELIQIKSYVINPVDSHEIPVAAISGRRSDPTPPQDVPILTNFLTDPPHSIRKEMSLAMSEADIAFTQSYFKNEEARPPTLTEIRMLDTYWSDHCRHTTFLTAIDEITFDDPNSPIKETYDIYRTTRQKLNRDDRPVTLMDIALIGMRELKHTGELHNLEESEEVNAASIIVPITRTIDNQTTIHQLLSNENLSNLPQNLAQQALEFFQAARNSRHSEGPSRSRPDTNGGNTQWAKNSGQIVPESFFTALGEPISTHTSEHQVWLDEIQIRAIKRTWPGVFGQIPSNDNNPSCLLQKNADIPAYLYRMALHIALFGSDIKLLGVTVSDSPSLIIGQTHTQPSAVISQQWMEAANPTRPHPNLEEIADFMESKGFSPVKNSFFGWLRPDGIAVIDAKPDNFILTENGIVPIDLQIAALPILITEEWLIQFKNETHNHPTEIEPFGGAATCLGGCIRDPLSGRSYVYQAMRVTGAANPLTPFSETLPGKLPQKKICQVAAKGYSSYGNQIGLATGQVAEVYHPGYVAKRLEIGAVVAAAPRSNVFRGSPAPGDAILLIGGRTGRDGVGGATGSSKEHTETALENSAEVQKGDAPTERKIQRLFRNPELTRKIKICNDFGAGGVSVAIGEIAPSLLINLDSVPKKYDGLDGTELAISESQERMAVCIDPSEIDYFISEADKENLECVKVADVTNTGRLIMTWRGKQIVNLSRAFLNTNGVQQTAKVHISAPLTPNVLSYYENTTTLLERSASSGFASSLGSHGKPVLDILTRVHRASQKAHIPEPTNRQERIQLERALRTIEERELRDSGSCYLNAADFNQNWTRQGKISGAEQRVYFDEENGSVIKANDGSFHGNWLQYLERLHLHQLLFPETAYTLLGILVDDSEISMVVKQPFAKASNGATRDEVEAWMKEHFGAYRYKNDDYYLPQLDLLIEDLHDENVLVSENSKALLVIDPVIYLRPADVPIPVPLAKDSSPHCTLCSHLSTLNNCSQRGLGEMFDSSVGAGTVLWPFGGKNQITPPDAMVAKLPLLEGETDSCTHMAWGFDPYLSEQSPFLGAAYAVTESVCKAVASGARLQDIRLTLQEYFPRLGTDPTRWALPFAALLGAYRAQHELRLPAIGGKDSMSGSFNELDVPPTLVSFALAPGLASLALSPEFKQPGSTVSLVETPILQNGLPDFETLKQTAEALHQLNKAGKILSIHHIGKPGLAAALAKSCFGNHIGFTSSSGLWSLASGLYAPRYFQFLIEHTSPLPNTLNPQPIGQTTESPTLTLNNQTHSLTDLQSAWESTLEPIYPTKPEPTKERLPSAAVQPKSSTTHCSLITRHSAPKVLIPTFPGTNSEYDSAKAFQNAGASPEILVFRNLTPQHIEESLTALAEKIRQSHILMFPGGFSAGDEPDGSAKFIATIIRSPRVADAIMDLIKNRDGLILGICNGFQALIKTGLVPYGEIKDSTPDSPTLVHNSIARHISRYAHTRITSTLSPWLANTQPGDIHTIPLSHGEGRFYASEEIIAHLAANGQIATQYCDDFGNPSMHIAYNPNGSLHAIESISSPCGRILGKMGHSERSGFQVAKNIPGNKHQPIFQAGVAYFQ